MSTRAQILAEIAAQFPDNTSGAITPAKLRQVTEDLANSCAVPTAGTGAVAAADITDLASGRGPLLTGTQSEARAVLGIATDAGGSQAAGYYVDSVNGDDTNSGRTSAAPLKTFAALIALGIADGSRIYLARGSYWREALDLDQKSNLVVSGYGVGAPWTIDGSDDVANVSFSVNATYADVYQAEFVAPTVIGTCSFACWENDIALQPFTSLEAVHESPTGGFWASGGVLYVKARDAGNVVTNGKTYSAHGPRSYGNYGCYIFRCNHGCDVSGGRIIKPFGDGGIRSGNDSNFHDCSVEHGTKHNLVLGSGIVRRVHFLHLVNTAWYQDASLLAFYYNGPQPGVVLVEDCVFKSDELFTLGSGLLGHTDGGGTITDATITGCTFENLPAVYGLPFPRNTFTDNKVINCGKVLEMEAGNTVVSRHNDVWSDTVACKPFQINSSSAVSPTSFESRGDKYMARTGSGAFGFIWTLSGASNFSILIDGLYISRGETESGTPAVALLGASLDSSLTVQNSTFRDSYPLSTSTGVASSVYSGYRNVFAPKSQWVWNAAYTYGLAAWVALIGSDATSETTPARIRSYPIKLTLPGIPAGSYVLLNPALVGISPTDRLTWAFPNPYDNYPDKLCFEISAGTNTIWVHAKNFTAADYVPAEFDLVLYAEEAL